MISPGAPHVAAEPNGRESRAREVHSTAEKGVRGRRPDIQGLRAVAVLMVLGFHAGLPLPGGFAGVDVFFVISGYVITSMLGRQRTIAPISLKSFYTRRFWRLTPALALVVSLTVVAAVVLQSPMGSQQSTAWTALGAMTLSANFVIVRVTGGYFDLPAATNPLLNTWSLSVEEQFYLVFPLLLLGGWLIARNRQGARLAPLALVMGMAGASFIVARVSSLGVQIPATISPLGGFYGPAGRLWEFAAGALLALWPQVGWKPPRAVLKLAGVLGIVMVISTLWVVGPLTPWPGTSTLLPVVGAALLLLAGQQPGNPASQILSWRPAVWIGDLSYSLYLWHWPLLCFAALIWPERRDVALAVAALSFIPAYLSRRFLEDPFRGGGNGRRAAGLAVILVAVPIIAALTLGVAANNGYWMRSLQAQIEAQKPWHIGLLRSCYSSNGPEHERSPGDCRWNSDATGPSIVLVGDSNADHFSEAVVGAAKTLGRPAVLYTMSACPFVRLVVLNAQSGDENRPGCAGYVDSTMEWLSHQDPSTVIISNSDQYWLADGYSLKAGKGTIPGGSDAMRAAYVDALGSTIQELRAMGHSVKVVQSVPHPTWNPQFCTPIELMTSRCSWSEPRQSVQMRQGPTWLATAKAATESGATIADFTDFFCGHNVCRSDRDGISLYRDSLHISVPASVALIGRMKDAISPIKGASGG